MVNETEDKNRKIQKRGDIVFRPFVRVAAALAIVAIFAPTVLAGPQAYIGMYADEGHNRGEVFIEAPYTPFETWVWVLPSDEGMICAEFEVEFPAWMFCIGSTPAVYSHALGDPIGGGLSICFSECSYDWKWLYRFEFLPTASDIVDYITIGPHPDVGALQAANCSSPSYPMEPLVILFQFGINTCSGLIDPPGLAEVRPSSHTSIVAYFDQCVDTGGDPYTDRFFLYNAADLTESIGISEAVLIGSGEPTGIFVLHLEEPMVHGTTYLLMANSICCACNGCADTQMSFCFDETISIKASSWGAIKSMGITSEIETR